VNYQNYANYPPTAPAQPAPPPSAHHQYHPPIAYPYDQAAANGAAAYQYLIAPPEQTMAKVEDYHQYPPLESEPEKPPPAPPQQGISTQVYLAPVPAQQRPQQQPQSQPQQRQQQLEKQPPSPIAHGAVGPTPVGLTPLDPMQADPVQPPAEEEPFKEPAVEITTVKDAVGPVKEENMTANTAATQAAEAVLPTPTEDPMAVEKDRTVEAMAAEKAVLGEALAEVTAPAPAAAAAAASEANEDETGEGEVFLSSSAKESTPVAETAESNGFPFGTILATLQNYQIKHKTVSIPTSDPIFAGIVSMLVENGIEEEADVLWNRNYVKLKEYKDRVGDCDVPFTDKTLGGWVVRQRHLHAELKQPTAEESVANQEARDQAQQKERLRALHASRLDRLSQLGFDFDTPMWDTRFRELMQYKETHNHVSPPVNYPKLGIWVINQKFNIKDMCKERVAALDSLGFVWNHNRKNRSQARWDGKYEERE